MKMQVWRWSLALLLPSLFAVLFASTLFADAGDPPSRVARLSHAQGKVSFQPSGESDWSEATINRPVTTGDRLFADQGARAELEVGPFAIRLSQNTDVTLANLNDQLLQLGVGQGTLRVTIYDLPANNSVEIDTPNGALILQAAGSYRVDTAADGQSTQVTVNTGTLQISAGDLSRTLQSGQAVTLTGTGPVMASDLSAPSPDDFDRWSGDRDRRVETSASMQSVGRGIPGGEDLDAYGQWVSEPAYGRVWYPNVPSNWAPYRSGHWIHIKPWSWTWVESEPWGYAPFHYGRWVRIHHVWAWVPEPVVERPVYAPALVVFVGGGSPGNQAWIPLGPGEEFTPYYEHGPHYMSEYNRDYYGRDHERHDFERDHAERHYANRDAGFTAVSGETFRGGHPVSSGMVHLSPEEVAHSQAITHLDVTPAPRAAFGAGVVPAPPVHPMRVMGAGQGNPSGWHTAPPEVHEGPRPGGPPTTPPPHVFTRTSPVPTNNTPVVRQETNPPVHTMQPQPVTNVETVKPTTPAPEKAAVPPPPKPPATPPPPPKPAAPKTPPPPKDDHKHH